MNWREAVHVAWHARVNGLDMLTPEHIREAFAVLEKAGEALACIEVLHEEFVDGSGNADGEGPSGGDVEAFLANLASALRRGAS